MKSLGKRRIKVADIITDRRLRAVDPAWVDALAANIRESGGLKVAIEVRELKGVEGAPPAYALIAGGHRLAAVQALGWDEIDAEVFECSSDEAKLREIDENLMRHELSPFDRAEFMFERKALHLKMHPETAQYVAGGKARQSDSARDIVSFAEETAERLGWNAKTISRSVSIAANLTADSKARIRGTEMAKCQADLLALCKLGPTEQAAVLAEWEKSAAMNAGERLNIRKVIAELSPRPPREGGVADKLATAWLHADAKSKKAFLEFIQRLGGGVEKLGWRLEPVGPAPAADPLPAMIEARREAAEAAGYEAYQNGEALDPNPYAGWEDDEGRLYFAAWIGGWNAAAEGEAVAKPPQVAPIEKPSREQIEAKVESDGYTAWKHDVRREQNPYVHSDHGLADAWVSGWDKALSDAATDAKAWA